MVPGPERVPGLEENKVGLSQPGLPPEQPCLVWEPLLELVGEGGVVLLPLLTRLRTLTAGPARVPKVELSRPGLMAEEEGSPGGGVGRASQHRWRLCWGGEC